MAGQYECTVTPWTLIVRADSPWLLASLRCRETVEWYSIDLWQAGKGRAQGLESGHPARPMRFLLRLRKESLSEKPYNGDSGFEEHTAKIVIVTFVRREMLELFASQIYGRLRIMFFSCGMIPMVSVENRNGRAEAGVLNSAHFRRLFSARAWLGQYGINFRKTLIADSTAMAGEEGVRKDLAQNPGGMNRWGVT
ncbi:hypothetical protein BDV28DRAFT_2696 [Aspergillus coremiiformis]|uniref:Uncharacterized protein n=1 Tax=Aspergillus coremiiformis TaxID=138285 RepID=A0A5N6ZH89_9EURO|nr:hypothetical protein BDV28DRAFT_2696 [Aspergillus coremiiformis]